MRSHYNIGVFFTFGEPDVLSTLASSRTSIPLIVAAPGEGEAVSIEAVLVLPAARARRARAGAAVVIYCEQSMFGVRVGGAGFITVTAPDRLPLSAGCRRAAAQCKYRSSPWT